MELPGYASQRLDSLTGLRFIAASLVLLRHSVISIFPEPVIKQLAIPGPVGVGFFFILSGFVLTWSSNPDRGRRDFYARRFARIYPLHRATMLVAALLFAGRAPDWTDFVLALLLLQAWLPSAGAGPGNGPSWSLSCEAFFYALFPFCVAPVNRLSLRGCRVLVTLVSAAMVVVTIGYVGSRGIHAPGASDFTTYTNPAYRFGEFLLGMGLATATRKGWRIRISIHRALAIGGFYYVLLAGLDWLISRQGFHLGGEAGLPLGVVDLLFVPAVLLLISAAAASDVERSPSPVRSAGLVKLGEWSFALYLIQIIVINETVRLVHEDSSLLRRFAILIGTLFLCIGASSFVFEVFEKPVDGWLRRRLLLRDIPPQQPGAATTD